MGRRDSVSVGPRPKSVRPWDDNYATPPWAVRALLGHEYFPATVWEPACGLGRLARTIEAAGYQVVATTLHDYGFGETGINFLGTDTPRAEAIITNPPFNLAEKFVTHAWTRLRVRKLAMFMRTAFLEGEDRYGRLFYRHPPSRVWQVRKRVSMYPDCPVAADEAIDHLRGGAMAMAWWVWERDHHGPVLGWLGGR